MSRIELPAVSSLSEDQKRQYYRFPANLTLALLRTTGSTSGYLSLGGSFPRGAIGNKDREMIILRVGALSRSPYERMQHLPLARQAGWSDAEIAAIEAGNSSDARSLAILRFVDECVRDIKVGTQTFAAVRAFFSETQMAELTLLIGHYMMTARFLETLEVPLDDAVTSWDNI
ncbi:MULTISPECIES: carboxymuconolactone decarboxylase family protein [Paraburkholderia]|uniref:Carboxymuconolactone decarboxylase family protein n=1 Tax=Paraburkholderia madseniana TaxID=2599607 RepID=A0AAP5BJT7_9BURK|nr:MULTISPECIES: carboxymuconolactone decarboxylase family protein [Paraburkholderia]MCX4149541.1 carboxymuconolactone decarboxylase family protein [Paraburkholderia madseniana]MDN7152477.1 carboxymuconolactone decarboxylase family protein [Paraburkholderia sp. WS6]MDQ6411359.1 carboxymuconolactone decarboxylase family protein [Paraburkholderia madseniana]